MAIIYRVMMPALVLVLCGCESTGRVNPEENDAGGDTDTDSDTDADSDGDCICAPGDLWCDANNWITECNSSCTGWTPIEECSEGLYCAGGECLDISQECAEAINAKSYIGCEYWAVNMQNKDDSFEQPYAIVVSNLDADSAVHVCIEKRTTTGYDTLDEADVPSKSTHVFMLGNTADHGSYLIERKAFRVSSDLPIVAYQFNPYGGLTPDDEGICSNDGTLLIPTSGMGKFYYNLAYSPNFDYFSDGSSMNIIAAKEDTVVKVVPSVAINAGGSLPAMPAGLEHEIMMQAADVVQLNSGSDLSGTYVESDKPVAVFGGNLCSFVPDGVLHCDHMEHQLFPVTTWGKEFVAARTVIRSVFQAPENDFWRVIASEDGTTVETEPAVPGFPVTLNAGQWIEAGVDYSFTISASAPIMVGQFLSSNENTDFDFDDCPPSTMSGVGDPAFALLPPHELFMKSYVFLAPGKYNLDYVVITHPAGISVNLDGTPVSENSDCVTDGLDADWGITRCLISDFTHTIDAEEPVGISVWGYGCAVSYGYTGGLDLAEINPIIIE